MYPLISLIIVAVAAFTGGVAAGMLFILWWAVAGMKR